MAWYKTGQDALKYADQKEQEYEERASSDREWWQSPFARLWLPVGAEVSITFVDGDVHPDKYALPWVVEEHQVQVNGDWKHWKTCIDGMTPRDFLPILKLSEEDPNWKEALSQHGIDPDAPRVVCPCCKEGEKKTVVSAYTVIDHSEFTDRKGRNRSDELKLLVAKTKTFKIIRKQKEKRGVLRGLKYELSRLTKDSPNAGDSLDFIERKNLPDTIQPAPYSKVFCPSTPKEMIEYFGMGAPSYDDDDIPF